MILNFLFEQGILILKDETVLTAEKSQEVHEIFIRSGKKEYRVWGSGLGKQHWKKKSCFHTVSHENQIIL